MNSIISFLISLTLYSPIAMDTSSDKIGPCIPFLSKRIQNSLEEWPVPDLEQKIEKISQGPECKEAINVLSKRLYTVVITGQKWEYINIKSNNKFN